MKNNKENKENVEIVDDVILFKDVTNVEVIDELDRSYIKFHNNINVKLSFHNNGKTLRISILKKYV